MCNLQPMVKEIKIKYAFQINDINDKNNTDYQALYLKYRKLFE